MTGLLAVLNVAIPGALHGQESSVGTTPSSNGQSNQPAPPKPATFHGSTEVVASRVLSEPAAAGRREVVLTREEIARLPVSSVAEVLALIPGAGLSRRGARGVQGDLNLRGSTFEQALVMVNGMRINNPQTGHHHLDLFLPLAAVERVEVLFGSGSALYGPDAFGGAVNIVTSAPVTTACTPVRSMPRITSLVVESALNSVILRLSCLLYRAPGAIVGQT